MFMQKIFNLNNMNPVYSELRPRRTRTRTGCLSCRRRRKKCDEEKPTCVACQRNRIKCHWSEETEIEGLGADNGSKIDASMISMGSPCSENDLDGRIVSFLDIFRTECSQPRPSPDPASSIHVSDDVQNFLKHTAKGLECLATSSFRSMWTGRLLEDAKAFPFIMKSLEAMTALHRAILSPEVSQKYFEAACESRTASVNDFCSTISQISLQNALATLTFASMQVILCLEFPISLNSDNASSMIDGAYELLISIRGLYDLQPATFPHITEPVLKDWMCGSPLAPSSPSRSSTPTTPAILRGIWRLYNMAKRLETQCRLAPQEQSVCYTALAHLYAFVSRTNVESLGWQVLSVWPNLISDDFLELIRSRHPMALIIMSRWFVIAFGDSGNWVLHRWAEQIVDVIAEAVGPEWHSTLRETLEVGTEGCDDMDVAAVEIELEGRVEVQGVQISFFCRHPLLEGYLKSTMAEGIE